MLTIDRAQKKFFDIVKMAIPGYKRHRIFLSVTDYVQLNGNYWDGGSKSTHTIIKSGAAKVVPTRTDWPFTTPAETVKLDADTVVVSGGVFCGRTATAHLYMSKEFYDAMQ